MKDYARLERDKDERNGSSGFVLHQSASSRRSRDCDRGSIRVFEERLASEPHGDWLSDSRNAQKAVSEFLISTAKNSDFYISEERISFLGERKRMPSGESIIYENAAQGIVYKVRDPFAKFHLKSGKALYVIYDHIVHNLLFPEARYRLIGVTSILGSVRFVLSQDFIYAKETPTQQQIDNYLTSLGLFPEDNYYYGNEFLSVTDVSAESDNVLLSEDGELLFIDPIIKMKKPIDEIINAYPFNLSESQKQSQGLITFIKRILRIK